MSCSRKPKKALAISIFLILFSTTAACTMFDTSFPFAQSHFTYPNSNVKPLSASGGPESNGACGVDRSWDR